MEPLTPEKIAELQGQAPLAVELPQPTAVSVPAVDTAAPAAQPKPSDALKEPEQDMFDVTLPDGRKIYLQKPAKATALHVSKCLGVHSINGALESYYRSLMWVKRINNTPIPYLANSQMFEALAETLGDDGLDLISQTVMLRGMAEQKLDVDTLKNA